MREVYMAVSTIIDVRELPAVLTMGDIQRTMRVAKKTAYDPAHRDGFPAIRLGRTIRVPREAFLRWLDQQAGIEA
jgi:excisionase family DNA binding protein